MDIWLILWIQVQRIPSASAIYIVSEMYKNKDGELLINGTKYKDQYLQFITIKKK